MWWASSSNLKALREKTEVPLKKEFCLQTAIILKTTLATLLCVSSLLACPADFIFDSPHSHAIQFLKISLSLSLRLCLSVFPSVFLSVYIHIFCFSEESWLIQGVTAKWVRFSFGDDENVIKLIVVITAQFWIVHVKLVNCIVCELYLKKVLIKKCYME